MSIIKEDQSDRNLIDRYLSGDKSTMPMLVRRWHKIFCQKAFWILREKDASKDVVQECWIIIINKLHTLKSSENFKSWALRIVYNKSIDAHKKRRKESKFLNTTVIDVGHESESEDDRRELKRKLLKAIRDLTKDKQDIIRLFYVEEYSLKEISTFLKIPIGTVKSRLYKAREKLKSIIK